MFLKLTDRFGGPVLLNMAQFSLVVESDEGGCKLHPGSLDERYHGTATPVPESIEAFIGLPGFINVSHPGRPAMLVNMERVARMVGGSDGSYLELIGGAGRIYVAKAFEDLALAAAGTRT